MPITTHTLTGDFAALAGEVATIRATIHTNSTDDAWVNDTDDEIRLGGAVLALNAAGEFTITLPTSTDTGLQYQVTAEYVNADRQRKTWQSGWFSLTANADLADKANDSTLRVNTTLGDQLAARIDGYTDHGDVSGAVTFNGPTGSHWFAATGPTTITLDGYGEGQVCSLLCFSGSADVTVIGLPDLELADGLVSSAMLARGVWVTGGGGGAPATPDTTPPSAITDLAAAPGEDGTTASLTFTPASDAESTARQRIRYYVQGGAAGAWPTAGPLYGLTASPAQLTGLTPGTTYVAEIQSYSAGGSQSVIDSVTFTTLTQAGWNVQVHDTFSSDGNLTGKTPDTAGTAAWTSTAQTLVATSGRAKESSATTGGRNTIALNPAGSTRARATMTFKGGAMPDTSESEITMVFPDCPVVKISNVTLTVNGYNPESQYVVLAGPTAVPNTAGVMQLIFEREDNTIRVYSGVTLLAEVVLEHSGYLGWSPTSFEVSGWKMDNAYIDEVKVEIYS